MADQNLDDLLNSIIAVESNAAAAPSVSALKKPSGIDLLLQQEEEIKKKRLDEERQVIWTPKKDWWKFPYRYVVLSES